MPTNRNRITFVCDDHIKEELSQWASEEKRSISNLVEILVLQALAVRQQDKPTAFETKPPKTKRRGKAGGDE